VQAERGEHGEAGDHDQRDPLWCPARQHVDPTRVAPGRVAPCGRERDGGNVATLTAESRVAAPRPDRLPRPCGRSSRRRDADPGNIVPDGT
jgi:hypothetical protein